jgi:EpsI family protein
MSNPPIVEARESDKRVPLPILLAFVLLLLGPVLAYVLTPRTHLSESLPPIVLEAQVPKNFGDWRATDPVGQVLPDPTVQETLDSLYSQVMSRTYVNSKGQQVMLTIAYGSDQNSEATAAHRPEFCYRAQGFDVQDAGVVKLDMLHHPLAVRHLVGVAGNRVEPISYWVTLADRATLPGLGRKLSQIYYGLHGTVADGMLVRVSSIGADREQAFALQTGFLKDMEAAVAPSFRARYFGS